MAKKVGIRWYKVVIECENCGTREGWEVRVGMSVEEAIERKLCPGCELYWRATGWRRVNLNVL